MERYGLELVEEPALLGGESPSCADPASPLALTAFHWSLLTGFVVLEIAYLSAVVVFAHRAVRWVIGG